MQITLPENVYELVQKDMEKNFMTKSSWFLKAVYTQIEQGKLNRPKQIIDLEN